MITFFCLHLPLKFYSLIHIILQVILYYLIYLYLFETFSKLLTELCKLMWIPCSLQANPPNHTEKTTESSVQKSLNPKLQVPKMHSIQNSMFHSEAHKITKKAPALSCIKSTRCVIDVASSMFIKVFI